MLNIKANQSTNECEICGILNELSVKEGTTKDGREYISGVAKIRVDQEIDGEVVENIIPINMFSMKFKANGDANIFYERIKEYPSLFKAAIDVEDIAQASRVTTSGRYTTISENAWVDKSTQQIRACGFRINSNALNNAKPTEDDRAKFKVTGVVIKTRPELDRNDEETGRLKVNIGIVGYKGKLDVVEMVATDSRRSHIENNWNEGDTVTVAGLINMTYKVIEYEEELGFGEPIINTRTESRHELFITGGSGEGLDDAVSYDNDDVKVALAERKARHEEMKKKAIESNTATTAKKKNNSSDFDW